MEDKKIVEEKKIVVVGAGASARVLIKNLKASKEATHITVIQPNRFASVPWYQTLVLTKRTTFTANTNFAEIDGADATIYGVAVGCSDGSVAVQPLDASQAVQQVSFDTLVCATGFAFPVICETPGQSKEERTQEIDKYADALTSGNNVVIAGGGATGIELVSDLLEKLPDAKGKVTLVCSADTLLSDQASYYGERCKQVLEELGAEIVFSDRVVSHEESTVSEGKPVTLELKSGKTLSCHVYVAAFGRGANTAWLKTAGEGEPLPDTVLNDKGKVVVDEYLQSTAYDKLYAMGATTDRTEPSLFPNVEAHAKTIAKNIMNPKSTKQAPGVPHAMYQIVGRDTFATIMPENLPMPAFCSTLCCHWCGFPFNMLCPCFCAGVLFGPCDPMMCGYCCGKPEGKGLANVLNASREQNMFAESGGYYVKGKPGFGEEMERS
jgi:NADH dehydrogenase FAD-containing subunit